MAKRCRRRNALKKKSGSSVFVARSPQPLIMNKEQCNPESVSEPARFMKQVKDCINEIYSEHMNDLEQRKEKRLESKHPTDYFQPYNLVVNWPFQQRIRLQIQAILKFSLGEALKEAVIDMIHIFIEDLYSFVKSFDGKKGLLQAIMIYEAFHTLQNSISQVGSIVSELISKYAFEIMNKKLFYEKFAFRYFELIENSKRKENLQYRVELNGMITELEGVSEGIEEEKILRYECASTTCSEIEEISGEALHNLPIDEIVKIINEDEGKKKRNRRKKQERSEDFYKDEDEVLQFQQRLESVRVDAVRLKPVVSEEFLAGLRERIKQRVISNE